MKKARIAVFATAAFGISSYASAGSDEKYEAVDDFSRAFPEVRNIDIEDFTGRIEVVVSDDDAAVIMSKGKRSYPVAFVAEGALLRISGEERPKNFRLYKEINWRKNHSNALDTYLTDYPVLKINLPKNAKLRFDEVITKAIGSDGLAALEIDRGYVEGTFGDVGSADIEINASGDIALGNVADELVVGVNGSGDFTALDVGAADLSISGSGSIDVGEVREAAVFRISGSGDLNAGEIQERLIAEISGSGDMDVRDVGGGARISIAGSGDMTLKSVNGKTDVNIAGNGDVEIGGGLAKDLSVSIAGSGSVNHGGASTNLDVSIIGSGSVEVEKNTGSLTTSGRNGVVIVNGETIKLGKKRANR
ncbi:MAG: DUF2807 domain-containing protein [Pseudomonadota bacterium]